MNLRDSLDTPMAVWMSYHSLAVLLGLAAGMGLTEVGNDISQVSASCWQLMLAHGIAKETAPAGVAS